ncbi:MAG: pseudaminic acid cytidylyltransferase [Butyrivibrio sp.]|nr:pseudaminic acid cytidylyltransferase [Butyrivibrio sp.]
MSSVAIITARGGSKRIPHKNIKEFCGFPIITYSIKAALESRAFDEVMVSTDDDEIADIALKAGATVPFRRSGETANDYASTDEVIAEVLNTYREKGKEFDSFCCIYPTAPFVTANRLKEAMELLKTHESAMPVVCYSYPPQRCFVVRNERLVRRFPEYATTRSQDLEKFYHDCGQFYACRTDAFFRDNTTDVEDMVPLILSEDEVQDIDTYEDWKIAEDKFIKLHPEVKNNSGNCFIFSYNSIKDIPTPFYHIDEKRLDEDIAVLINSLKDSWGNYIASYSVKTNSLPWLLKHLKEKGFFAEVVSDMEYDLAKRLGYEDSHIIHNGPIKDRSIFEAMILNGGIVNIDSSDELIWIKELSLKYPNKTMSIGIRVNFDITHLCPEEVPADEDGSRFGFCYENGVLGSVISDIKSLSNIKITGLHLHSSTKSRSVKVFAALAASAVKIATEFGLDLEYVDMGGGYYGGVTDKPDYRDYMPAISKELSKGFDSGKTKLIVEPGVSLISAASSFVTSVTDTKRVREHVYIQTDGSRVNLNPQVTRHWYPHHNELTNEADTTAKRSILKSQWVCGATCMEYDRLFEETDAPEFKKGDKIIYDLAGGYTMCLTPLFIHYFPGVYISKADGSIFTARKPWNNDQYLQNYFWE